MPTVLRWKGYRFFFWSGDRAEPPHIHVKKGRGEVKVWLMPVDLAKQIGFADHEINAILKKVREEQPTLLETWHEHFGRR